MYGTLPLAAKTPFLGSALDSRIMTIHSYFCIERRHDDLKMCLWM